MTKFITSSGVGLFLSVSAISISQAQIAPQGTDTPAPSSTTKGVDRAKSKPGWNVIFYEIKSTGCPLVIGDIPLKASVVTANDTHAYGLVAKSNLPEGLYAYEMNGYFNITEAGEYGFDLFVESDRRKERSIGCQSTLTIDGKTVFDSSVSPTNVNTYRVNNMAKLDAGFLPAKLKVACIAGYKRDFHYTGVTTILSVKKPFDTEIKLPDANFVLHEEK